MNYMPSVENFTKKCCHIKAKLLNDFSLNIKDTGNIEERNSNQNKIPKMQNQGLADVTMVTTYEIEKVLKKEKP